MKKSLINSTLGTDEKIVVQPAASTISLAQHLQSRCLSAERNNSQSCALKGRTFDLKAAFKQLGIEPSDLPFAKVLVWDPVSCKPVVLALKALPDSFWGNRQRPRFQSLQPSLVAAGRKPAHPALDSFL